MTDIELKKLFEEISGLSEGQKREVSNYVRDLKRPPKGINPFKDFCKDEPELLETVFDDVLKSRELRRKKVDE
jgi:hypothetical protein